MKSNIKKDLSYILLFSSLIPVTLAALLLFYQTKLNFEKIQLENKKIEKQIKFSLYNLLLKIEMAGDVLIESRELADTLLTPPSLRPYTSNLLYGRIQLLKKKSPEITQWQILDEKKQPIFVKKGQQNDTANIKMLIDGFHLEENTDRLVFTKVLKYDDQNMPGPTSSAKGYLILITDLSKWKKNHGYNFKIVSIPLYPLLEKIIIQNNNPEKLEYRHTFLIISLLALILIITTIIGFILVKNRIIAPLKSLTEFVLGKTGQELIDNKEHEILILKKAFKTYMRWESDLKAKLLQQSKLAAIGQTTSMLAHDIRKPLSQVKLILDAFDLFRENPSKLKSAKTDVEQAISNVESMLNDVMDFSRDVKLETKPTSIGRIFDFVIRQTVQGFSDINISFTYYFNADNEPLVDEQRIARVLANIISNGIEAITVIGKTDSGTIDISTNNYNKENRSFTELIIGNDGPPLPEGIGEQLFESFYTSGKAKGTGLGLASAKKIVTLHDGKIYARNKPDNNGVEFVIRLPSSDIPDSIDEDLLPQHSDDVFLPIEDISGIDKLLHKMEKTKKTCKILLLEDEVLYRAWVKNLINTNRTLSKITILYDASTVEEAMKIVKKEKPEYTVIDLDLNDSKDGYDFLQLIKDNKSISSIVHSNRTLEDFKQKALKLGAKNFVPKPLPLSSLVEFLSGYKIPTGESKIQKKPKIKRIYACDDTNIIIDHWEMIFDDYLKDKPGTFEYELFPNGEALLKRAKEEKPSIVFTDLKMNETGGRLDGYEVIKEIKKISRKTKAYLISNEPIQLSEGPTKTAGGDGALEQPLVKNKVYTLIERNFKLSKQM